jgi:Ca2+-binding EF-hand superfamily protein
MKKLFILSGAVLMAASALAVAANGKGRVNFSTLDINSDGVIVAEEAKGKTAKYFENIDADGNSAITQAEFDVMKDMMRGNKQGRKGNKGKRHIFKRMDTDSSGDITEQEFNTAIEARQTAQAERTVKRSTFAALDTDTDGQISEQEFDAAHEAKKIAHKANKKGKGKKGKNKRNCTTFTSVDTDENGQISEQELNEMHAAKEVKVAKRMTKRPTFSMLDADGNGVITKAEHKVFSKQHSAERKSKKQSK